MLLSKEVEVTVNYKNIERYLEKGYEFETFINKKGKVAARRGTKIIVKIEDLDLNTGNIITYKCDYCGKEVNVRYCDYMRHYQDGIKNDKDCCSECVTLKTKEVMMKKYGVESSFELKEVQDKIKSVFLDKYGVDSIGKCEEVQAKARATTKERYGVEYYMESEEFNSKKETTFVEKYGVDNPFKRKDIQLKVKNTMFEKYGNYYVKTDKCREKYKNTCIERYGVDHLFKLKETIEKTKATNIKRYGVEHLMQIPEIARERIIKTLETKSNMGVLPTSRQQEYLHEVYGGENNYIVSNCVLDIAFLDENIYIEYDGSGHALRVKFNECTQEEFERQEMARKYFLLNKGWREIRIVSNKDYLPSDDILLKMKEISLNWFDKDHRWIKFYIDENKYETSEGFKEFNYGKLRKIKEEDLETA